MVATSEYSRPILDYDTLAEVAELRTHCRTWEGIASEIGWDVNELRRATRRDSQFPDAVQRAIDDFRAEVETEMIHTVRQLMRTTDPVEARKACELYEEYLAGVRRDRTRLEVERLRAEAKIAAAEAKIAASQEKIAAAVAKAKAEAEEAANAPRLDEDGVPLMTREQEDTYYRQRALAQTAAEIYEAEKGAREGSLVFLWGGCHKIGGVAPDETDTPLMLVSDDTVMGRHICWAMTKPAPVWDIDNGPFLAPPGLSAAHLPRCTHRVNGAGTWKGLFPR